MDPRYSALDYTVAHLALRPQGLAWPEGLHTVQADFAGRAAYTYERSDARAQQLLIDGFPSTAVELLPEWEASLGLPDPCAGASPTLQQRQGQVAARFAEAGGQSIAYFTALALRLGFVITIRQHAPSRFGRGFGRAFGGEAWAHAWTVVSALNTVTPFRFGRAGFGEPFAAWGNTVLECEIRAAAPAHTVVIFSYV